MKGEPAAGTEAVRPLPSGPARGRLRAPGSKSHTNRALIVAGLAAAPCLVRNPLASDDGLAMRSGISALGAAVEDVAGGWLVKGTGGRPRPAPATVVDARLSGTSLRFLVAAAALADKPVLVTGEPPLLARPIEPLLSALRALGADARGEQRDGAERPPVWTGGRRPAGGAVTVD